MQKELIRNKSVMNVQFVLGEFFPGICIRELAYGCAWPGYSTPKMIRNNLYIHIVVSGTALINGSAAEPGDVFVMRPHSAGQICVTGDEPFCQYWFTAEGDNLERMLNLTALRDHSFVKSDMSHLYDILHDGVFSQCYEELLPIKIAGIFQLVISSLPAAEDRIHGTSPAADYVNHAVDFLRLHYASGITLSDAADAVGITEKYLYKLFLREMNTTPSDYLNKLRLNRAEMLLTSTRLSVAEIAYACGYKDAAYFSRFFSKVHQCSPTEYRKNVKPSTRTAEKKAWNS